MKSYEELLAENESLKKIIREAQEQEPVGEVSARTMCDGIGEYAIAYVNKSLHKGDKLYAAPIPPADVAELQRERDEFHALLKEKIRVTDELIRKLDNEWLAILRIVLA